MLKPSNGVLKKVFAPGNMSKDMKDTSPKHKASKHGKSLLKPKR